MPDVVLGGTAAAGQTCYKNSIKCNSHPAYIKVHFSSLQTRTAPIAPNTTTTVTQIVLKLGFLLFLASIAPIYSNCLYKYMIAIILL